MNESKILELSAKENGINYYTVYNETSLNDRKFGIKAEMAENKDDFEECENLFLTEGEANAYCKWFAQNEVYPVALKDVLLNIFNI